MLRKWHKFAGAALLTAGFGGLVIAGTANGAQAPACHAPTGSDCLAIVNHTAQVHSFRFAQNNGQCLKGPAPGKNGFYTNVFISEREGALLYGFTGDNCEGNSQVQITRQYGESVPGAGDISGYQVVQVAD